MQFYQIDNVNRAVPVPGQNDIVFAATEFVTATNSQWGIYATENPAEVAALDAAVAARRAYAISAEEYAAAEEKKNTGIASPNLINFRPWHAPQQGTPPAAAPVAVAEPETVDQALAPKPVQSRAGRPIKK